MDTIRSNGNYLSMTGIDDISELNEDITALTRDVLINNAKVGITIQQSYDIELNNLKVGITPIQAENILTNNAKIGITPIQSANIVANNAKVGITPIQSANILTNNAKIGITPIQSANIVANNLKIGITPIQSANILTNNAKIGITPIQSANILTNNAKIGITEAQMAEIEKVIAIEEIINSHGSILTQVVLKTDTEYIDNSKLVINGEFNMGSLTLTDFVKLEGENLTIEPDFGDTLPRTLVVSSRNSSSQIIIKDIGTTNNGGGFLKYDSVTGVFSIGSIANNETLVDMIKFLPNETTADIYMPYGDLIVNGVSVLTTRTDLNNLTNTVSDLDTLVTVGLSASIAGLTAGAVVIGTTISGLSAVVTGHTASIALKEDKITGLSDITMKDLNCGNITMRGFADFFDFQDADLDLDGKIKCEKSITAEGAITGGSLKSWNTDINAFGVKTNYVKTGDENIIPDLIGLENTVIAIDCYGDIDLHGCRIRNVNNINMSGSSITNMSELTFKEGGESHIQNIKQITGQDFSITPTDATFGGRAISSLQTAVQVGGLIAAGIALLANSSDLTNEVNARIQAIDEINNTLFVYPSVRYVKLLHTDLEGIINLAELEAYTADGANVALNKNVTSSGFLSGYPGDLLVNGIYSDFAHTSVTTPGERYMMVDLGATYEISRVKIWNRTGALELQDRAIGIKVQLIHADGVTILKEEDVITTGLPSYTFQYTKSVEKLDNEIDARIQADEDLQANITIISSGLATEINDRASADIILQTAIDTKASITYVDTKISNLVDSSPATLDTLNELAFALGDNPNFATTITELIGTKANTADVVNITQNQIITGAKTFKNDIFLLKNSVGDDKINVNGLTTTLTNTSNNVVGNFSVTGTSRLDGTVTVGGDSNGSLLYFNAERDWEFRTEGVDAGTILIFQDRGSSKTMEFRRYDDAVLVRYLFNTINPRVEIYGALTTSGADVNLNGKIKSIGTTTTLTNTTIAINGATTFDTVIVASAQPSLDTHLTNKLFVETNIAIVSSDLTNEVNARIQAEEDLQTNITTVSNNLATEKNDREDADADLQTQITNINSGTSGANLVHIDTAETITGAKTFQNDNFLVENSAGSDKINVNGTTTTLTNTTNKLTSARNDGGDANYIEATGTSAYNKIYAGGTSGYNTIESKRTNNNGNRIYASGTGTRNLIDTDSGYNLMLSRITTGLANDIQASAGGYNRIISTSTTGYNLIQSALTTGRANDIYASGTTGKNTLRSDATSGIGNEMLALSGAYNYIAGNANQIYTTATGGFNRMYAIGTNGINQINGKLANYIYVDSVQKIKTDATTTTLNNTTTKIQSGGADKINVNGTTTTLTNNTINLASYPSVRYIKLYHSILNTIINLWELEAYTADGTNVALNKNVTSSVGWFSTNTGDKLVNGNYADMAHTSFPNNNTNYYILVDLGANFPIKGVKIWNRWDGGVTGSATRAIGIKVQLMDADGVTILKENTITTTEETYTYNYSSDKMVTNATETTLTNNSINLAIDNGDVKYQHTDQFTLIRNDRVYLASTSGSGFALEINGLGSDGATTLLNNVTNKIQSGFGNDKITVNASTNTLNNTTTKIQSGGADKINVTGTTTTLNNTTTKIQSGLEVKMVTNETTTTLTNTTINFATEDIRVNNIPLITQIWGFYQKGSSFFGNNWLNHAPIRDNDVDGCVGMVSCVDILPYAISVAVENDGATATETGNVTFYVRCIDYTDPANQGLKRRSDLQNLGFNLMDVGQCVISMGNDVTDYAVLSSTQYIPAGTPFGIFFTEGITNFAAEVTVKLFCSQGRQGILQNPGLDLQ